MTREPSNPALSGLGRNDSGVKRRRVRAAAGSLLFLAVAPGVMGGFIPYLLTGWDAADPSTATRIGGIALTAAGAAVLLDAFARFALQGLGTPAPIAPTEQLVVTGPNRYVRNPMYLAVTATILGQGLLLGRPVLLAYAVVFLATTYAFVRGYEEPTLQARYGEQYDRYREAVPGWWPRCIEKT